MKPHIKKVPCIDFWGPPFFEGHVPNPGYHVYPFGWEEGEWFGAGVTIEEAWKDYLELLKSEEL